MQDTLNIAGSSYEYDFSWLYTLETGYSILAQWKDSTQVCKIIFLNNFVIDYTKMLAINVYSAMLPTLCRLHNCQRTKANIDNEATHNEIRNEESWLR